MFLAGLQLLCITTPCADIFSLEQFRKLGSALARHTGQDEGEKTGHLVKRASILLQKGLAAMVLNRIPGHPNPVIDGQE